MDDRGPTGWARAYRTPLWLAVLFVALLVVFALTPDPTVAPSGATRADRRADARPPRVRGVSDRPALRRRSPGSACSSSTRRCRA